MRAGSAQKISTAWRNFQSVLAIWDEEMNELLDDLKFTSLADSWILIELGNSMAASPKGVDP
jgi:hypothetical protein